MCPVALGFKGSERGSKLSPVANNDENIASWRQQALSACRSGRPVWGLLGVHPLL